MQPADLALVAGFGTLLKWRRNIPGLARDCRAPADADPGNAGWQRDLALSLSRVAMADAQRDMVSDALRLLQEGRNTIGLLIRQSPENATLPEDLRVV